MAENTLSDYLIREDDKDQYTITKWSGRSSPEAEYKIKKWGGKLVCDCPRGSRNLDCKHPDIIRSWIKMGKPDNKMIEAHLALASDGTTRRALQSRLILRKIDEQLQGTTDYRPMIEFKNNQEKPIQVQYKEIGGAPAFKWVFSSEKSEPILENKTILDAAIKDAAAMMKRKLGK